MIAWHNTAAPSKQITAINQSWGSGAGHTSSQAGKDVVFIELSVVVLGEVTKSDPDPSNPLFLLVKR